MIETDWKAGLSREGQYYRSLLDLGREHDAGPLLERALKLLIDLTGASVGYIEVREDSPGGGSWTAAQGCDDAGQAAIRDTISRGIVAETLATGQTVTTASAIVDPRFGDRESVKENSIEAVICAPLGDETPFGVVYLQGGAGDLRVFARETQGHVTYFARAITPFLERLLARLGAVEPVPERGPFERVRYRSQAMREVVERLRLAAPLDIHVLLTGPTGAGKTLLAQSVHGASTRSGGPFVEVNCAAIPESLLENELFGADEGAHSAVPRGGVAGKVRAAEGGTLFLDEIGELSLASQAKLLQLLQSRTYHRLGSAALQTADVRVIAATNLDLVEQVALKRFRQDLYYRLNVLQVRVPSLAEREDDIVPLAAHFVRSAAERHRLEVHSLSPGALRAILHAEWPGNVRELAHRIESGVVNAHLRGARSVEAQDLFSQSDGDEDVTSLQEAMRRFQKRHVLSVLEQTDWNITEASRRLDVARSHVYTLIKLHDLRRA